MEIDDYIVATDARLVELAAEGDQQAFEYLFTRYRDALTRLFEQRLGDKDYSWEDVAKLVPSMVAAGLMGHLYTCPDMIGGGEYFSFLKPDFKFDQEFIKILSCRAIPRLPRG